MLNIKKRLNITIRKQISTLLELHKICFSVTENYRNHQIESPNAGRLSVAAHQVDDISHFNVCLESCGFIKRLEQRQSHKLSALTIKESFTDMIRVFQFADKLGFRHLEFDAVYFSVSRRLV